MSEHKGLSKLQNVMKDYAYYSRLIMAGKYQTSPKYYESMEIFDNAAQNIHKSIEDSQMWLEITINATKTGIEKSIQKGDKEAVKNGQTEMESLESLKLSLSVYKKYSLEYIRLADINLDQAFVFFDETLKPLQKQIISIIQKLHDDSEAKIEKESEEIKKIMADSIKTLIISTVIALFLSIVLGLTLSYNISHPIIKLTEITTRIQKGEKNIKADISSKDEIGVLADNFNQMTIYMENYATTLENYAVELENYSAEMISMKNFIENILNSMVDMLVVMNPDTSIKKVNKSTLDSLGYEEHELIGKPISMLIKDEDENENQDGNEDEKNLIKHIEMTWLTKTGKTIPVLFSGSVIKNEIGRSNQGIVCIAHDITRRKQAEIELKNHQKLLETKIEERTKDLKLMAKKAESLSHAKSEFLANMSHEIRTPLNGILGMSELLMDTVLDETQKNFLYTVTKESNALLNIINDILDFSKIEAGKLEIEKIPFNLRVLLEDVSDSLAYRAEKRGLELMSFISPEVPSNLVGDPGRLRQILMNIGGNAIKFTNKGEVFIKGELVKGKGFNGELNKEELVKEKGFDGELNKIELNKEELVKEKGFNEELNKEELVQSELEESCENIVYIRFSVKDTGIGIPKDKQSLVFESFSQADSSTTRQYGGTGLGTTISKQLTELMGGELGLESEEGKGSTFWFAVPLRLQPEQKDIPENKSVDLTDLKVLVVDDNQTNRNIQMEYLASWGCVPYQASGGEDALILLMKSLLSSTFFDLILSDAQMPDMDGFEFVKELKMVDSLKTIPVLMLTSMGIIGDAKTCKQIGINGYLPKPVKRDHLRRAIEKVLGLSREEGNDTTARQLITRHFLADEQRENIRILLVEDYPTNQDLAMLILTQAGFKVDLAKNGQEAVNAYKEKMYNLVLMDIQMPVKDGYQATREIREIEAALKKEGHIMSNTPIIAMTAHALDEYVERCVQVGMNDYLTKPLKRKKLLEMVDKWSWVKNEDGTTFENKEAYEYRNTFEEQGVIRDKNTFEDKDSIGDKNAFEEKNSIGESNTPEDFQSNKENADTPINYEQILEEFGGNKIFVNKALDNFPKLVKKQLAILRKALSNGDTTLIANEAHKIKGGAANLTAMRLFAAAELLEQVVSEDTLEKTDSLEKVKRLEKAEPLEKADRLEKAGGLIDLIEKELKYLEDFIT
ncbi:MAG: response regulator [Desulfamplus sp.]|nr:response regulator [Desulfamplus sp.]